MAQPHLYVFYTMAGQEDQVVHLLQREGMIKEPEGDNIPASMECVFVPKTSFVFRRKGVDALESKNLYRNYTFFQTTDPRSFYLRLQEKHFFSRYGKFIRMLKTGQDLSNFRGSAEEWANCMGRIDDDEERDVLGVCGLKRDGDGNIIRKSECISAEDEKKLEGFGVDVDSLLRMATTSPASSEEKKKASLFNARMSRAIKLVKRGVPSAQRDRNSSRIVVFDGPLVGMENSFIKADAHKRQVILRTEFMHTETRLTMPLEIKATIEVDDF